MNGQTCINRFLTRINDFSKESDDNHPDPQNTFLERVQIGSILYTSIYALFGSVAKKFLLLMTKTVFFSSTPNFKMWKVTRLISWVYYHSSHAWQGIKSKKCLLLLFKPSYRGGQSPSTRSTNLLANFSPKKHKRETMSFLSS